jgi:hypothetical protein
MGLFGGTLRTIIITKRSGLKSAGYKNCTRRFKIVYLKWTSEHIKKQLSKMLTTYHNNNNKNHIQGKSARKCIKNLNVH